MSADPSHPLVDDTDAKTPQPPAAQAQLSSSGTLDDHAGPDAPAASEDPAASGGSAASDGPADPAAPLPGEVDSPASADDFDLDDYLAHTQVEIMEPRYRVSGRAPLVWTLENCWTIVVLSALQVGWYFYGDNVMAFWNWVALVATAWIAVMSLVLAPTWRYFVARWDFSDTAVYSKTGWWTHHYRIAPISRLQTVYTKRSFFARLLGLATVVASTASAHGSVQISGLLLADAERLSDHLLHIAALDESDAT